MTQRLPLGEPPSAGDEIFLLEEFGWLYVDLDDPLGTPDSEGVGLQAWVTAIHSASGRFSVGFGAVPLHNTACDGVNTGSP